MTMLLSALLTFGLAWWFYKTALRLNANAIQWAGVGAVSYQLPAWAWMLEVSKPYVSGLQGTAAKSTMSAWMMSHSWLVVGVVTALLVYRFALLKTNVKV